MRTMPSDLRYLVYAFKWHKIGYFILAADFLATRKQWQKTVDWLGKLAPSYSPVQERCSKRRVPLRVRRHFRFEAKWSETEAKFFSLRCEKKWFFRLFRIDAKHRNLKRNENETKRKRNEKEAKLPSFSLRSEMKRNRSEIIFASMRKIFSWIIDQGVKTPQCIKHRGISTPWSILH